MKSTWMQIAIPLAATIAIVVAFGGDANADQPGGPRFGQPGFDSTSVVKGQNVRITGASFFKSGDHYYDVSKGTEITYAEARARAQAEGQALP